MRKLTVIVAAAAAVLFSGMLYSPPALADYNGGGPIRMGKLCWVATDAHDYGYWKACPKPAKAAKRAKKGKKAKAAKKK